MKKSILDGFIGWGAGALFYILAGALTSGFSYNKVILAISITFLPGFIGGWFLGRTTNKIWGSVVGGMILCGLLWGIIFFFTDFLIIRTL